VKRTPMPQRKHGLERTQWLRAEGWLPRQGATGLSATSRTARTQPAGWHRKDTGPSRKVRALVLKRDGWSCVACGRDISDGWPYSLQHRLARGQGGGNQPFNLVTLCGTATSPGCHLRAERRDRDMHAAGYYLESWQDSEREPVMIHGAQGGVTVWLTDDGRYAFEPIPGAA